MIYCDFPKAKNRLPAKLTVSNDFLAGSNGKKKRERERERDRKMNKSASFSVTVNGKQWRIYFFVCVLPINRCSENFDRLYLRYLSYVYSEFLET